MQKYFLKLFSDCSNKHIYGTKAAGIVILLQTDETNLWYVFLDLLLRSTLSHCDFISSYEWSINSHCKHGQTENNLF